MKFIKFNPEGSQICSESYQQTLEICGKSWLEIFDKGAKILRRTIFMLNNLKMMDGVKVTNLLKYNYKSL